MNQPLLSDIWRDDTPISDDEQPNDNNSNEDSPSPPALIAINQTQAVGNSLSSPTVTTPNRRPRALRHRKIIKAAKTNSTKSGGALLSELQKTNAAMLELTEKVKRAEKRMRNMEKKVKRSSKNKSKSPGPNLKNIVPIGIRVRKLASYTAINMYLHFTEGNQKSLQASPR